MLLTIDWQCYSFINSKNIKCKLNEIARAKSSTKIAHQNMEYLIIRPFLKFISWKAKKLAKISKTLFTALCLVFLEALVNDRPGHKIHSKFQVQGQLAILIFKTRTKYFAA